MRKIREILRLLWECKLSQRQAATCCGILISEYPRFGRIVFLVGSLSQPHPQVVPAPALPLAPGHRRLLHSAHQDELRARRRLVECGR